MRHSPIVLVVRFRISKIFLLSHCLDLIDKHHLSIFPLDLTLLSRLIFIIFISLTLVLVVEGRELDIQPICRAEFSHVMDEEPMIVRDLIEDVSDNQTEEVKEESVKK